MKIWSLGVVLAIQSLSNIGVILMTASPGLTANIFQDILERIFRPGGQERPRSVRGGNCLVGPSDVIWSDRPQLAWDNGLSPVKIVKITKSGDSTHPVWSWEIDSLQTSVQYDDKPLPPDVYQWSTTDSFGRSDTGSFEVMERVEQKKIGDALLILEQEIKGQKLTDDDRILRKIEFWLDRNLPWDAMSEIYAYEGRSTEAEKLRQDFVDKVCRLKPSPTQK